jgi:uncharacterized membrane protein YoaK (UPF0700 family)
MGPIATWAFSGAVLVAYVLSRRFDRPQRVFWLLATFVLVAWLVMVAAKVHLYVHGPIP